jgi:starch-binding outer membrane protein, SusD/RagB family
MTLIFRVSERKPVERQGAGWQIAAVAAGLVLAVVGCNPSDAIKVKEPDNVQPGQIQSAAGLPSITNAALSSMQIAYSGGADLSNGGHEGEINISGLLTDEMQDIETFTTRIQIDGRLALSGNQTLNGIFIDLASARSIADQADAAYNKYGAGQDDHSLVLSYGGYAYTLFAENWCEGVPVSSINASGAITYGQPLTRPQLLAIAIQRFDSAITIANANEDNNNLYLAQIGLARALMDSSSTQYAAAAAAVSDVPTSYVYLIGASTNAAVENNGIWNYTFNNSAFSVSDKEGTNGLPFVSANDPRVPSIAPGYNGTNGSTPMQQQQLYPLQNSPIPLATGIEAQLIIAEAQLAGVYPGSALATLNALRACCTPAPGLPPIAALPANPDSAVSKLMYERAFWLYLTSHRLGDLRRMIRQYNFNSEKVFPVGLTDIGNPYGTSVNFEIPAQELANPNFHGCLYTTPPATPPA